MNHPLLLIFVCHKLQMMMKIVEKYLSIYMDSRRNLQSSWAIFNVSVCHMVILFFNLLLFFIIEIRVPYCTLQPRVNKAARSKQILREHKQNSLLLFSIENKIMLSVNKKKSILLRYLQWRRNDWVVLLWLVCMSFANVHI